MGGSRARGDRSPGSPHLRPRSHRPRRHRRPHRRLPARDLPARPAGGPPAGLRSLSTRTGPQRRTGEALGVGRRPRRGGHVRSSPGRRDRPADRFRDHGRPRLRRRPHPAGPQRLAHRGGLEGSGNGPRRLAGDLSLRRRRGLPAPARRGRRGDAGTGAPAPGRPARQASPAVSRTDSRPAAPARGGPVRPPGAGRRAGHHLHVPRRRPAAGTGRRGGHARLLPHASRHPHGSGGIRQRLPPRRGRSRGEPRRHRAADLAVAGVADGGPRRSRSGAAPER